MLIRSIVSLIHLLLFAPILAPSKAFGRLHGEKTGGKISVVNTIAVNTTKTGPRAEIRKKHHHISNTFTNSIPSVQASVTIDHDQTRYELLVGGSTAKMVHNIQAQNRHHSNHRCDYKVTTNSTSSIQACTATDHNHAHHQIFAGIKFPRQGMTQHQRQICKDQGNGSQRYS